MGTLWDRSDSLAPQRDLAEALTQYRGAITIQSLVTQANQTARDKRFYDPVTWESGDYRDGDSSHNAYRHSLTNEQLLHAVIEMGEASQIFRKTGEFSPDLLEELADVWIVLADLIGRYGLGDSFAEIIAYKLAKNQGRPTAYGNARAQATAATPEEADYSQFVTDVYCCLDPGSCTHFDTATPVCCGEPGDCNEHHKGLC